VDLNNIYSKKTLQACQHPFHLVGDSKLPFMISFVAATIASVLTVKLHDVDLVDAHEINALAGLICDPIFSVSPEQGVRLNENNVNAVLVAVLLSLMLIIGGWAYNLIVEARANHTRKVQTAFKYGMLLFILSEFMLFFPFFWAFFHGSLSPSIMIGGVWPPVGILEAETLDPFMLPLLNTVTLLSSGVAIVSAHRAILAGYKTVVVNAMYIAISLGILFSWLQFVEYGLTKFTINDGLYGSVFFMLTGLHGFHVIVGTILLLLAYIRAVNNDFSTKQHVGFETAAWYWHFVDVIWLFVYTFIYIW